MDGILVHYNNSNSNNIPEDMAVKANEEEKIDKYKDFA